MRGHAHFEGLQDFSADLAQVYMWKRPRIGLCSWITLDHVLLMQMVAKCASAYSIPTSPWCLWLGAPQILFEAQGTMGRPFRLLPLPYFRRPKHRNRIYLSVAFIDVCSCQSTVTSPEQGLADEVPKRPFQALRGEGYLMCYTDS